MYAYSKKSNTSSCISIRYDRVREAIMGSSRSFSITHAMNANARNTTIMKVVMQLNHPSVAILIS